MNPKLTGLLIAIVFISLISGMFGIYIVKVGNTYGTSDPNVSAKLAKYNRLSEAYTLANENKNKISSIQQSNNLVDIVGGFFYNCYKIAVSIPQSFNMYQEMIDDGTQDANLGEGGTLFRNAVLTILIIQIFIGVILAIILRVADI